MKLEDIKLGMKVIITQDRTGNGWTSLHPDIAKAFIGKVGNVRGKRMEDEFIIFIVLLVAIVILYVL